MNGLVGGGVVGLEDAPVLDFFSGPEHLLPLGGSEEVDLVGVVPRQPLGTLPSREDAGGLVPVAGAKDHAAGRHRPRPLLHRKFWVPFRIQRQVIRRLARGGRVAAKGELGVELGHVELGAQRVLELHLVQPAPPPVLDLRPQCPRQPLDALLRRLRERVPLALVLRVLLVAHPEEVQGLAHQLPLELVEGLQHRGHAVPDQGILEELVLPVLLGLLLGLQEHQLEEVVKAKGEDDLVDAPAHRVL
mmetsp:Transcript_9615/g.24606  ORF Transcript_9615/g.24606 Transcript_9615/m.24606 type:complete len:246 (+) Transcript_9615:43-780(+)